MDEADIRELIYDLDIVLNKLASAKKDTQRHLQGCGEVLSASRMRDDPDNLQARVDRLEDTMTDVAWEIDSVRDDLFKIIDALEEKMYKSLMDDLSKSLYK
jgi:ABC-type transporter Mla subunit MlaD